MTVKKFWVALALLALAAAPAMAISWMSGSNVGVQAGETVRDDLALAGQSVSMDGLVNGELFAAGSIVRVSGKTTGDAWLIGNQVASSGPVGGSLRAAGSGVGVSSKVARDLMAAASNFVLAQGAAVGRDLAVAGANVNIYSPVGRNLLLTGANATLGSKVGGSAVVKAESLTLLPGAVIRGNLNFTGQRLNVQPGAKILGEVIRNVPEAKTERRGQFKPLQWLLLSLALIIFGAVLTGIFPGFVGDAASNVRGSFGPSLGWGVLVAVVGMVAIVVAIGLSITIILAPVMLSFLAIYAIVVYASVIFVGAALGKAILGWFGTAGESAILNMLVGTVVLSVACGLPYVGWIIWLLSAAVGLGALLLWLRTRRAGRQAQPVVVAPPPPPAPEE